STMDRSAHTAAAEPACQTRGPPAVDPWEQPTAIPLGPYGLSAAGPLVLPPTGCLSRGWQFTGQATDTAPTVTAAIRGGAMMQHQPADCVSCCSAGSISNGYCMS